MGISSGGLISGLDSESIISQLTAIDRQPIVKLQQKEADYQVKLTSYGSLQSALSSLKTAASALDSTTDLTQYTGTSSNTDAFTASVFTTAAAGTYDITVESTAQVHKLKSGAFGSTEAVGAGKFTLQLGAGTAVDITVSDTDTLQDVANHINDQQKDVRAAVITDGTQSYLTLTGQRTGEVNKIRLDVTEDADGNLTDAAGLSRLLYVDGGASNKLVQTQGASDAILTIDGVQGIHRPTNVVADVIKGVTLTLKAPTDPANPESLTVSRDTSSISNKVKSLVDAYNAVVDFFNQNQSYNATTKKGGVLLGDGTANLIRNKLTSLIGSQVAGASDGLERLSELGITTDKTGKLTIDSTDFNDALTNRLDDVVSFFTVKSGQNQGFAVRMVSSLDAMLNTSKGELAQRTSGIQKSIDRINDDIEKLNDRVSSNEERLRKQFQNLETLLGQYQSTGDYLTQQITALQNLNQAIAKK